MTSNTGHDKDAATPSGMLLCGKTRWQCKPLLSQFDIEVMMTAPQPFLRMARFGRWLALAVLVGGAAPAAAAPEAAASLLDPPLDYSAQYSLSSSMGRFQGALRHSFGMERRDFQTSMGPQTLLLRRDRNSAAMLWPDRHWYLATSFQAVAGLIGGFDTMTFERSTTTVVPVNGEKLRRVDITGTSPDGGRFTGQIWLSWDNIVMRISGTSLFRGEQTPFEMSLSQVKRTPQDPTNFEIPAGYQGMQVDPSMLQGNLGGR